MGEPGKRAEGSHLPTQTPAAGETDSARDRRSGAREIHPIKHPRSGQPTASSTCPGRATIGPHHPIFLSRQRCADDVHKKIILSAYTCKR
jgi:hypothetical protein